MGKIAIVDLEVHYCVGVTDQERAQPQKLLLTVEMNLDFTGAALTDRVGDCELTKRSAMTDSLRTGSQLEVAGETGFKPGRPVS